MKVSTLIEEREIEYMKLHKKPASKISAEDLKNIHKGSKFGKYVVGGLGTVAGGLGITTAAKEAIRDDGPRGARLALGAVNTGVGAFLLHRANQMRKQQAVAEKELSKRKIK